MTSTRIKPEEARAKILAALRANGYTGKTTEIAQWVELHPSVVRRAGVALANKNELEAVLVPGRGKGEYRFTLLQLDLFLDSKKSKSSFPSLKQLIDELARLKAKLLLVKLFSKLRAK